MSTVLLPRRSLVWLLLALLVAVLPHAGRLPIWVLGVLAVCLGWRLRVYQGRWAFPSRLIKYLLVFMAFVAVGLQYRTVNGLEPAAALLVIAGGLKAMELKTARDYLVIVFVGYFLVASELLFAQEMYIAVYASFALCVITAALVARHQWEGAGSRANPLRVAARLLVQALPLMLVMFVVFPRISPLWSIPQKSNAAKTGPSDRMSPGDVARLSNSSELAFRVTFVDAMPPQRELYWRGLVFSEFDGREWSPGARASYETLLASRGAHKPALNRSEYLPGGREVEYEVILEPSNQPWAYVLGYPLNFDESLRLGSDHRLMTGMPVTQRMRYRVRSDLAATVEPTLRLLRRRAELQLPEGFNSRSLALARQWRAEAGSDAAYIDRILAWFNRENFVYTLQPSTLGRDSVDEFLFDSRRGFCEHYASAFVVLMRAAGVPARVVVGYQGGERNPFEDYLLVHQFDAHAWAEAWIEGRGWVRIDPTAAVAPERIESGLSEALGSDFLLGSPLALERYRGVPVLAWLGMRWDLINYQWARMVLQYDTERQFALLNGLLGVLNMQRLVVAMLVCGAVVLLLVAWSLFGGIPSRRRDQATETFLALCSRLESIGLRRRTGEGPNDYCQRVATARPELAAQMREITERYIALSYQQRMAPGLQDRARLHLKQQVRRMRWVLR